MAYDRRAAGRRSAVVEMPSAPGRPRERANTMPTLVRRRRLLSRGNSMRPLRVLVMGQHAVGKTAMVVRFVTHRFIGDYDPKLQRIYSCETTINNEKVCYEILDMASENPEEEALTIDEHIRWADAFLIVYSASDRCSFEECTRLRFLINHCKKSRRMSNSTGVPVFLVGTKGDLEADRMVTLEEGYNRSVELRCTAFYDVSSRESLADVRRVFTDLYFSYDRASVSIPIVVAQEDASPDEKCPSPRTREQDMMSGSPPQDGDSVIALPTEVFLYETNTIRRKRSISNRIMCKVMPSRSNQVRCMERSTSSLSFVAKNLSE